MAFGLDWIACWTRPLVALAAIDEVAPRDAVVGARYNPTHMARVNV